MKDFSTKDLQILRKLAGKVAEISNSEENIKKREMWYKLDSGEDGGRPMVLAEIGGIRDKKSPLSFIENELQCTGEEARGLERGLKGKIFLAEKVKDDQVIEDYLSVPWQMNSGDFGVKEETHTVEYEDVMTSNCWDPPIKDLDKDFDKLKHRRFSVDKEASLNRKERWEKVFNGILDVEIRSWLCWSMGLTNHAIKLIGMENLMLLMYDNPEGVHRLMSFLRDDFLAMFKWAEEESVMCLNNKDDYIGSGSRGYTKDLPADDFDGKVRSKDLWVLLESQATVMISPQQFEEFIFPYQRDIAEVSGKIYYGCCEPVHDRWNVVKKFPKLSRVSVSPWCDQQIMADCLKRDYVFSRKPNPTLISTGSFNEEFIRKDIRETMKVAGNCRLEIIMKDVHTLNNEPERISRWVEIAREETESL